MPGSPAHLIRRFFDVANARPLNDDETAEVASWVGGDLFDLFSAQEPPDQRHGYHAARSVVAAGFEVPDVIEAALLHDVGKRHARLGLIGRSVASVLIILRMPMNRRMRSYRDHGVIGAAELADAGAGRLTVEFARHHHGSRPTSIQPDIWDALVAADQPPKTSGAAAGRITSEH